VHRIAILVVSATLVAVLSGCGSAASDSSGHPSQSQSETSQVAVRIAVHAAATLDRQFPHAHETTMNLTSVRTAGVSYAAGAFAEGWVVEVVLRDGRVVWVIVRDGHGTVLAHGRMPRERSPDESLTLNLAAITDCRHYPCKPTDYAGCRTCGQLTGVPIRITGQGVDFSLRTPRCCEVFMPLPPGRYAVAGSAFRGMHTHPRHAVLGWRGQTPAALLVATSASCHAVQPATR
jgi:hypothetical protein